MQRTGVRPEAPSPDLLPSGSFISTSIKPALQVEEPTSPHLTIKNVRPLPQVPSQLARVLLETRPHEGTRSSEVRAPEYGLKLGTHTDATDISLVVSRLISCLEGTQTLTSLLLAGTISSSPTLCAFGG